MSTCGGGGGLSIGSTTNTATVNMKAGQFIQIGPGFSTAPGAVYTAEIGTTDDCQTLGIISSKTNQLQNIIPSEVDVPIKDINGIKLYAYPNPTDDIVTVGISNNNYQNVSFIVTDISGRIMSKYNTPATSIDGISQIINVDAYATGLYIVTMTADNQKFSTKFVKQ